MCYVLKRVDERPTRVVNIYVYAVYCWTFKNNYIVTMILWHLHFYFKAENYIIQYLIMNFE